MTNKENDLNLDKLNATQKEFFSDLVEWRPDFEKYCKTEIAEDGQHNLRVLIPSPTGDNERDIFIWVSDGDLSIEFGTWHTHIRAVLETDKKGYFEEYSIIDLVKMIVANEIVYFTEIGGKTPFSSILNLRNKYEIARELTGPYSTGQIDIRSWDGTQDRRITIKDLTL